MIYFTLKNLIHSQISLHWWAIYFFLWKNCFIHKHIGNTQAYIKYRCRLSLILTSPSSAHFMSAYFMVKETKKCFYFIRQVEKREKANREREKVLWHSEGKSFVCLLSKNLDTVEFKFNNVLKLCHLRMIM
jgi:hypothetical protein